MMGTGYFLKIAKINLNKKNQSVLLVKISSRKTQKVRQFLVGDKLTSRVEIEPGLEPGLRAWTRARTPFRTFLIFL